MENKILKISITIAALLIGISIFYYLVILPNQSDSPAMSTHEKELRDEWRRYWDLVQVYQCEKAFNEYLSSNSKNARGYETFRQYGCENRKRIQTIEIEKVVFSDDNRADIKVHFEPYSPNLNWDYETWINENGQWKRDF